jgi:hypothetical protein
MMEEVKVNEVFPKKCLLSLCGELNDPTPNVVQNLSKYVVGPKFLKTHLRRFHSLGLVIKIAVTMAYIAL